MAASDAQGVRINNFICMKKLLFELLRSFSLSINYDKESAKTLLAGSDAQGVQMKDNTTSLTGGMQIHEQREGKLLNILKSATFFPEMGVRR